MVGPGRGSPSMTTSQSEYSFASAGTPRGSENTKFINHFKNPSIASVKTEPEMKVDYQHPTTSMTPTSSKSKKIIHPQRNSAKLAQSSTKEKYSRSIGAKVLTPNIINNDMTRAHSHGDAPIPIKTPRRDDDDDRQETRDKSPKKRVTFKTKEASTPSTPNDKITAPKPVLFNNYSSDVAKKSNNNLKKRKRDGVTRDSDDVKYMEQDNINDDIQVIEIEYSPSTTMDNSSSSDDSLLGGINDNIKRRARTTSVPNREETNNYSSPIYRPIALEKEAKSNYVPKHTQQSPKDNNNNNNNDYNNNNIDDIREKLVDRGSLSRRSSQGKHSRNASDSFAVFGKQSSLSMKKILSEAVEIEEMEQIKEQKKLDLVVEDSAGSAGVSKQDEEKFKRMVHERQRSRNKLGGLEDIELVIFDDHNDIPAPSHDSTLNAHPRKKNSIHNNLDVIRQLSSDYNFGRKRSNSQPRRHTGGGSIISSPPKHPNKTNKNNTLMAPLNDDNSNDLIMVNYDGDNDNVVEPVDIHEFVHNMNGWKNNPRVKSEGHWLTDNSSTNNNSQQRHSSNYHGMHSPQTPQTPQTHLQNSMNSMNYIDKRNTDPPIHGPDFKNLSHSARRTLKFMNDEQKKQMINDALLTLGDKNKNSNSYPKDIKNSMIVTTIQTQKTKSVESNGTDSLKSIDYDDIITQVAAYSDDEEQEEQQQEEEQTQSLPIAVKLQANGNNNNNNSKENVKNQILSGGILGVIPQANAIVVGDKPSINGDDAGDHVYENNAFITPSPKQNNDIKPKNINNNNHNHNINGGGGIDSNGSNNNGGNDDDAPPPKNPPMSSVNSDQWLENVFNQIVEDD